MNTARTSVRTMLAHCLIGLVLALPSAALVQASSGNLLPATTPQSLPQSSAPDANCVPLDGGDPTAAQTCGEQAPASQEHPDDVARGAGNPIDVVTGNKYQRETDLPALPGVLGIEIVRHYNSAQAGTNSALGLLGRGWRLSYETDLYVSGGQLHVVQADGTRLAFIPDGRQTGRHRHTDPARGWIQAMAAGPGKRPGGYRWSWPDGRELDFDAHGKLVQIRMPTGEFLSLTRGLDGELVKVTDPQGRSLSFEYAPRNGRGFRGVVAITSPLGRFGYAHQDERAQAGLSNLVAAVHPDGTVRRYHYGADAGEAAPAWPHHLTGISLARASPASAGETGEHRLSTYAYDRAGRAIMSVRSTPRTLDESGQPRPGTGSGQVDLEFVAPDRTVLTNSLGLRTTYRHTRIHGEPRLLEVLGPGCASCGEANVRYEYDERGRLARITRLDPTGRPLTATTLARDHAGRLLRRSVQSHAEGRPGPERLLARYEYADDTPRPALIARPSVVPGHEHRLQLSYNDAGQVTRIVERGFSPLNASGEPGAGRGLATPIERSSRYRYAALGGRSLLIEVDGPLPDDPPGHPSGGADLTRFERDATSGRITAVVHPMGLVESFGYDAAGRLARHRGVDGRSTTLRRAPSGQVIEIERDGALTRQTFDAAGKLASLQDVVGQRLEFVRDAAGQLGLLRDAANNRILLSHDSEGQLRAADALGPDGAARPGPADDRTPSATGPAPAERDTILAGVGALITAVRERANPARPERVSDPYALLRHFIRLTHDDARIPQAESHARDNRGATTTYHRNDFGWLERVDSPVTGTTRYLHDAAGRLIGRLQHDGSRADYQRDAAGRIVGLRAQGPQGQVDEDAHITWGAANKPTRIRYLAGEERFEYDHAARLVEHTQIIDGRHLRIGYRYDARGRILTRTLPGGEVLDYRYRHPAHPKAGLLESVRIRGPLGLPGTVVFEGLNEASESFGSRSFRFGNGLIHRRELDASGRILRAGNPQVGQSQLHDPPTNDHRRGANAIQAHSAYQVPLGRRARAEAETSAYRRIRAQLLGWRGTTGDSSGNPLPIPGIRQDLMNVDFDTLGRQIRLGPAHFEYDSLGRLVAVKTSHPTGTRTVASYRYNAFGQRIAKTVVQADGKRTRTTHYFHDGGQLVAEADGDGDGMPSSQYLWLDAKPVGMLRDGRLFSVHTDHRNAPLALTDESRQVVWQARVQDYLRATPVKGAVLGLLDFNLRGSNQYFDAETGLHYNTHRYYDPIAASYLTPDPIGLAAGPDLYAFALNRPHELSDPFGLAPQSNEAVSDWPTQRRIGYSLDHAATQLPGELGEALRELVSPEALATTATIFGLWSAAQFTPYGWAADLALAGIGYLFLGSAIWEVIDGVYETSELLHTARCEDDLRNAGNTFASALAAATANAGAAGSAAGAARIASLLRRIFKDGATDASKRSTVAAISEQWFGTFTPGRARSGAAENAEYLARRGPGAYPPWMAEKPVTDTWLNPGQKIYIVEGLDQKHPGGWATDIRYTSLEEARNELSLLKEFKDGNLVVREYTVQAPIPVREGTVGSLKSRENPSESYPGGGFQWEILLETRDNSWEKYLTNRISHRISK